jgi:hypothetical protein
MARDRGKRSEGGEEGSEVGGEGRGGEEEEGRRAGGEGHRSISRYS